MLDRYNDIAVAAVLTTQTDQTLIGRAPKDSPPQRKFGNHSATTWNYQTIEEIATIPCFYSEITLDSFDISLDSSKIDRMLAATGKGKFAWKKAQY